MTELFLIVLVAFAAYSLFSKAIDRSLLTLPILFTGLGLALSAPLQNALPGDVIHEGKKGLAEVTLILVLFSDASHVRFRKLVMDWQYPTRMLVIGLPLTIALGTAVAFWLNPTSGLAVALLTAAVLTPTDAALGQSVVNSPDVPDRLAQTINIESGLNDGLVLPFVLTGAILASAVGGEANTDGLALEALIEVILGPLAGIAVGWTAAKMMDWAQKPRCDAGSGGRYCVFGHGLRRLSLGGCNPWQRLHRRFCCRDGFRQLLSPQYSLHQRVYGGRGAIAHHGCVLGFWGISIA